MTLDEAIKHAEEVANANQRLCKTVSPAMQLSDYGKCAEEHRQLAEWLKDYKRLKEQQPCEDCISRNEAILLFQRYGVGCFDADDFSVEQCTRFVISKLRDLPPVTPQPKTGHWIRVDKNKLRCSECDVIHLIAQYPLAKIDWCPNCGTKMGSDENDEG